MDLDIKKERERLGMTQKELADNCGIFQHRISDYERGIFEPSLSALKKITEALGLELKVIKKRK